MRFLIFNTDYPLFLRQLYRRQRGLSQRGYAEQLRTRNDTFFGISDAYPHNLRLLGHEAEELHINNVHLQRAWAREHGVKAWYAWPLRFQPTVSFLPFAAPWYHRILEAQIEHYQPDVTISHAIWELSPAFLKRMKSKLGLLIGQIAAPLPETIDLSAYDLMLSSLPNFVRRFEQAGVRARLFRLGFDERVLTHFDDVQRDVAVSFVGTISASHSARTRWLEAVCAALPVQVWGQGVERVPRQSAIARAYQGPAWGLDMYRVLARSRITLNRHIDIAGDFANNMRLYEATGMGACLLTDEKKNMAEILTPGEQAATYRDTSHCIELAGQLGRDDDARMRLAEAGQRRTLAEHSYNRRMRQLEAIIRDLR